MKKHLLIFVFLVACISAFAQGTSTGKIGYQAVIRDSENRLVVNNNNITVKMEVIDNATPANVLYSEMHYNVQSNANGLISLLVGAGTEVVGDLSHIAWDNALFRTTITVPGMSAMTGISPITAVPYAFYAEGVDPQFIQNYIDTSLYFSSTVQNIAGGISTTDVQNYLDSSSVFNQNLI